MYNVKEGIDKQKQFILPLLDEEPDIVAILQPQYQQIERALENIEEGCSRIKTIVEDLRTFSRLDEADRKTVNLIDSLKATIRITQTQYKKHVQITTDFQAQPELECWPAKLNQVFMNIIVNACHAIEKQQEVNFSMAGLLTISSFESQQADGKKLALAFQDNGSGMTEETKKKIFDPFFTTKPLGQGTGLGMSISYSIIQEHKGHIQIDSELGQGTKITLYLPLSA
jgi:signal transduction histidine kinase